MIAGSKQSAPAFSIQPAKPEHASQIRNLVLHTGINPTGLNWERFLVALTADGDLIGCGRSSRILMAPRSSLPWLCR